MLQLDNGKFSEIDSSHFTSFLGLEFFLIFLAYEIILPTDLLYHPCHEDHDHL